MNEYGYPVSYLCDDNVTYSEYYETIFNKGGREDDFARIHVHKFENGYVSESDGKDESKDKDESDDKDDRNPVFYRTFRDHPRTENFVSYFTGIKSAPLPKPWFELDEDDELW